MAKASEADLCAAVARAGGLGLIGAGYMSPATLSQVYKAASQQLKGSDVAHSAVGVGLFNYSCSEVQPHEPHCDLRSAFSAAACMKSCMHNNLPAIGAFANSH